MNKRFSLLFLILLFHSYSYSTNIIRDSEIEETISLIIEPLVKASHLKECKVYIINDNSLNAFTAGGNVIYIHSGLINTFNDIDVIRGVIAHEIGHIIGGHIARREESIENYRRAALISAGIIGLPSIFIRHNPLVPFAMLGSMDAAERSILAYSRIMESSADQAALRLLEQSKNSSIGMIKFFEHTSKNHRGMASNIYDSTHPADRERITALKSYYQKSHFQKSQNTQDLEYKFSRSYIKLFAFTGDIIEVERYIKNCQNKEIAEYGLAIANMRKKNFTEATRHMEYLLQIKQNDPYYNELYGQILFEFGKKEALDYYYKATNLRPNDMLIKLGLGIVGITVNKDNSEKMKPFYLALKTVLKKENNNILALYYLSRYYDTAGLKYQSLLNSAIIMSYSGNIKQAKKFAKAAIEGFQVHSADWYVANDIILTEE